MEKLQPTQPWVNPTAVEQLVYDTAYLAAQRLLELGNLKASNSQLQQVNNLLAEQADVDPLTGLTNRRSLKHAFAGLQAAHFSDNRRRGSADSGTFLLVLDLDGFKEINDTQGHAAGDDVIQNTATIMLANVRPTDPVARWGGDEFVLLLPRVSRQRADEIANSIRLSIQEKTAITASIGVGSVDFDKNLYFNVDIADQALLTAKQGGKNIVVHFDQLGQVASQA